MKNDVNTPNKKKSDPLKRAALWMIIAVCSVILIPIIGLIGWLLYSGITGAGKSLYEGVSNTIAEVSMPEIKDGFYYWVKGRNSREQSDKAGWTVIANGQTLGRKYTWEVIREQNVVIPLTKASDLSIGFTNHKFGEEPPKGPDVEIIDDETISYQFSNGEIAYYKLYRPGDRFVNKDKYSFLASALTLHDEYDIEHNRYFFEFILPHVPRSAIYESDPARTKRNLWFVNEILRGNPELEIPWHNK